jgi:hypothetical protein
LKNIETSKICAFPTQAFHVLIIDDNSPDHVLVTKVVLLQLEFSRTVILEKREKNQVERPLMFMDLKWAWPKKYDFILKWMPILLTTQMT